MPPATARTALAPVRARRSAVSAALLTGLLALTACGADDAAAPAEGALRVSAAPAIPDEPAAETAAPDRARPAVALPVKALDQRRRPDVLVTAPAPFAAGAVAKLAALAPAGSVVAFRAGTVKVAGKDVRAVGVDPSAFRAFAAEGTAEATAVWQSVARGEAVVGHDAAKALGLALGKEVGVTAAKGGSDAVLRLGALATTGVPGTDLVVDDETGRRLGLPAATAVLLSAPKGQDPVALAGKVRAVTGKAGEVDLLTPPTANPVAFLTGSKAAKAFGAFSYRYFPDGTIQPDARWVRENIRSEVVPVMGRVTCHRLMLPQLRGALQDVVDAGLASSLKTFDGCYVPRFIERNPENSISLHTWGIAIDMDASTNYRGIRGTMNPEVVKIFKRWGFRWGGDWTYTDPMHFELAALLSSPQD